MEPLLRERDRLTAERNAAARSILVERQGEPQAEPMPIIVGVPRSGTTLLRMLLDAHSSLAIPLETHFLPDVFDLAWEMGTDADRDQLRARLLALLTGFPTWSHMGIEAADLERALAELEPFDVTVGLRAFYSLCAAAEGKTRAGDKTPVYTRHLPVVEALIPESHFIHIVRDGRGVYLSARSAPRSISQHWFPLGLDVESVAAQWRHDILLCRRLAVNARRFLEIRYEDLLADTPSELERVCRFVGLEYEPTMLTYYERTARMERLTLDAIEGLMVGEGVDGAERGAVDRWIERSRQAGGPVDPAQAGRWRRELSREEVEAFEAVAGDVLARYGYELTSARPS